MVTWRGNLTSSVTSDRKKKKNQDSTAVEGNLKKTRKPSLERGSHPGYFVLNYSQVEGVLIISGIFSHGSAVTVQ